MRISDWSSDVCSSDLDATAHRRLRRRRAGPRSAAGAARQRQGLRVRRQPGVAADPGVVGAGEPARAGGGAGCRRVRSEEHTSELQSLMRISYAVFCLKKKKRKKHAPETRVI